jgi:hypothetical protein
MSELEDGMVPGEWPVSRVSKSLSPMSQEWALMVWTESRTATVMLGLE